MTHDPLIRECLVEHPTFWGNMTYFVYQDARREWRWYLQAGNNQRIANSAEGYRDKQDCLRGITLAKAASADSVHEL